jgi:hypothetical protein
VEKITGQLCREIARLPKSDEAAANHAVDFELAIYNIWKRQTNSRLKPIAKAAALARIELNQLGCDSYVIDRICDGFSAYQCCLNCPNSLL